MIGFCTQLTASLRIRIRRRGWGGKLTPEVDAKTSGLPFVALLSGRQSWRDLLDELKLTNAALAVLVALSLHRRRLMRVL